MTIQAFENLDEIGKGEAILQATYIDSRSEAGYQVSLYSLDLFFIEVFYSNVLNEIFQIRPFNRLHMLDPYLEGRSLDKLLGRRW